MAIRWYLATFFLAAAAGGHAAPLNAEFPFVLDPQGSVVVSATIRGLGPFPLMLDTGSSHSAISDDLARDLALTPIARAELQTSAGRTMVPVVDIEKVSVGGTTVNRLQASILTTVALKAMSPDIRGVLGQDFLSAHHFTIDYSHRRLRWDDLGEGLDAAGDKAIRVPLVQQDGRFVMQVAQKSRDEILRLVADTGSSELVLFESDRLAGLRLTAISDSPLMTLSSLTGSQSVRLMRVKRLAIGALTLRDRLAVVVPPASREYLTVDGLLPLHTFRCVSFRQRDGFVLIGR
jgi:predicted aspartyl protease